LSVYNEKLKLGCHILFMHEFSDQQCRKHTSQQHEAIQLQRSGRSSYNRINLKKICCEQDKFTKYQIIVLKITTNFVSIIFSYNSVKLKFWTFLDKLFFCYAPFILSITIMLMYWRNIKSKLWRVGFLADE